MAKQNINQKRFIRRVARKILKAKGKVEPIKEYQAIYPSASYETAMANSSEILNSDFGKKTMAELLAVDYPKNKRSKRLSELANAEKDHVLQDGTIIPIRDNAASLRALELMAKFDGDLTDSQTNIDARSVNISLDSKDIERLSEVVKHMQQLRSVNKPNVGVQGVGVDGEAPLQNSP